MATKSDDWPNPAYPLGDAKVLHAAGAVAALFNVLENDLKQIFRMYSGMADLPAAFLFERISTELRIDIVRQCLPYSKHHEDIKDLVRHFLSAYSIAHQNRNVLMHSRIGTSAMTHGTIFQKTPKGDPLNSQWYEPSLTELREAADKTMEFSNFAGDLMGHTLRRYYRDLVHPKFVDEEIPLPSKPELPVLLSPRTQLYPDRWIPPPEPSLG